MVLGWGWVSIRARLVVSATGDTTEALADTKAYVSADAVRPLDHVVEPAGIGTRHVGLSRSLSACDRAKHSVSSGRTVDLDAGRMVVRRSRQRPQWVHGCEGNCGRKRAGQCPARRNERTITSDTKSRAGRRVIGLPPPLVELLRQHQAEQNAERFAAAQLWQEDGWIFASPTGQPINLRTDNKHWKNLLTEAGVRDVRLHDARHTAATVLLLLGVPERAVMGIMGWSNSSMAARYQHLTAVIQDDIAARVGGLLWASNETTNEPTGDHDAQAEDD